MNNLDINKILAAGAATAMTLEQIIKQEIDDWSKSPALKLMLIGQKYYVGDNDILNRKRMVIGEDGVEVEDRKLANNRLIHTFVRKLVDQKVGYLLSKPMNIQTSNDAYAKTLNDLFGSGFLRVLKNIGKDAVNKGLAWLQVYYDEKGELAFKRLPAEEIIPLWKDAAHTQLDSVIRCYDVEAYEGTTKKIIKKVEYWDNNGVKRYVMGTGEQSGLVPDVEAGVSDSHFVVIDGDGKEQPYNWERVPFICFKYNDEEIPLIKMIKSLIDDYDLQTSDNSNNLADLPNGIYVLKDYDGQNLGEFRRNLAAYRAIKVMGDGGVDTLSLDINTEALKSHTEQLRKDIYEFGRGVDTQSKEFGNSPSGVALQFMYADLDMDANNIETEFQAGLEQLRWFIDVHLANSGAGDYSKENVDFIFNRDILINETDTITNAKNSKGVISDETIRANHPWVTDPKEELKRIEKEKQAEMDSMQFYGGLGVDPNSQQTSNEAKP